MAERRPVPWRIILLITPLVVAGAVITTVMAFRGKDASEVVSDIRTTETSISQEGQPVPDNDNLFPDRSPLDSGPTGDESNEPEVAVAVLDRKSSGETEDDDSFAESEDDPNTADEAAIDPDDMRRFAAGLVRPWEPDPEKTEMEWEPQLAIKPEEPRLEPELESEPEPEPPPPPVEKPKTPAQSGSLVLSNPWTGAYYTSLTEFTGTAEHFTTLEWSSEALNSGGEIPVNDDGTFLFNVSTHNHSEPIDVRVAGVDEKGEAHEVTVVLENDGIGPSLDIKSPLHGDYYADEVTVEGSVGPGPYDPEGIGEIESLLWALGDTEPRPVFFDAEGGFSFRTPMSSLSGAVELVFAAVDLNGNETRKTIRLQDGRLTPTVTLSALTDGDEYGAGVRLAGIVDDPYGGIGSLAGIDSLRYEFLAADAVTRDGIVSGTIEVDADGIFDASVLTLALRGNQDLTVIATGKNGRETYLHLRLKQGRSAIPDFTVESSDASALAKWNPVPTAAGYQVRVLHPSGTSVRHDAAKGPFAIRGLENGEEYTFQVDALLEDGRVSSHEVKAIPLTEDTLKPSVNGEFRRIRVTWNDIPGSDSYAVFRSESPDGPYTALVDSIEGAVFLDTEAAFGTAYWYRIAPASYRELLSVAERGESLASQRSSLEQVGNLGDLRPDSISIEGDYALIASRDAGLVMVDITEPARPVTVGRCEIDDALDVEAQGAYAYVAAGTSGLKIVNIEDPQRPLQVGSKLAGIAVALEVKFPFVFVADRDRGLRVLDVSNSHAPTRIYSSEGLAGMDVVMTSDGETLFLAAGNSGVVIFDITASSRPKELARATFRGAESLYLDGEVLSVGGPDGGLSLYDVSDPESPEILSSMSNLSVLDLEASEDFLLATSSSDLYLIDVRNPRTPTVFQSYPTDGSASLAVHNDNLLIASEDSMGLYQTYLVGSSFVTQKTATSGRSYGISESNGTLLVASHSGGVSILDKRLSIQSEYATDFAEAAVHFGENRILVADGPSGVRVLSPDDGGNVLFENSGYAHHVAAAGDTGYAATDSGIFIVSSDESSVRPGGTVPLQGCRSLFLDGDKLYAVGADGLRLYLLPDDGIPVEVSHLPISDAKKVSVRGEVAAVSGVDIVYLVDISDERALKVVSSMPMSGVENVTWDSRYLYVSSGFAGLKVYDVRRPDSPKMISSCKEVFAHDAVISGDSAFVVDGDEVKKVGIFIPHWLE